MREALLNLRPRSLGRSAQSCTPLKLLFPEGGRGCLCFRCSRVVAVRWSCAAHACVRMEEPCSDLSPLTRERESNTHILSSSPPPTRWQSNAMCGGGGEDRARDPVVSRLIALLQLCTCATLEIDVKLRSWFYGQMTGTTHLTVQPRSQFDVDLKSRGGSN